MAMDLSKLDSWQHTHRRVFRMQLMIVLIGLDLHKKGRNKLGLGSVRLRVMDMDITIRGNDRQKPG